MNSLPQLGEQMEMFDVESIPWMPNCVVTEHYVFTADDFAQCAYNQPKEEDMDTSLLYLECALIANSIIGQILDEVSNQEK